MAVIIKLSSPIREPLKQSAGEHETAITIAIWKNLYANEEEDQSHSRTFRSSRKTLRLRD